MTNYATLVAVRADDDVFVFGTTLFNFEWWYAGITIDWLTCTPRQVTKTNYQHKFQAFWGEENRKLLLSLVSLSIYSICIFEVPLYWKWRGKLLWISSLALVLTGTTSWDIVESFTCRTTWASFTLTSFDYTNKIEPFCLLFSLSSLVVCTVVIIIRTGSEFWATTFLSHGNIPLAGRSIWVVQRMKGTARFWTTPNSKRTRQSAIIAYKVIIPRTQTGLLVALYKSGALAGLTIFCRLFLRKFTIIRFGSASVSKTQLTGAFPSQRYQLISKCCSSFYWK